MEKMLTATQAERRFLAENHFGIYCLYYYSDYFKYEFDDYHYLFMMDIEDLSTCKIREVLWIGFRESTKTTLAQLGVSWYLIFKKKTYINADSYASANSERSLFDIAHHLINNQRLIADFGKIYDKGRDLTGMKQSKVNNFTTEN